MAGFCMSGTGPARGATIDVILSLLGTEQVSISCVHVGGSFVANLEGPILPPSQLWFVHGTDPNAPPVVAVVVVVGLVEDILSLFACHSSVQDHPLLECSSSQTSTSSSYSCFVSRRV